MRRRREDMLRDDITEAVKSKGKGILGFLIKGLLSAMVEAVLQALRKKGWVTDLDELA